MREHLLHYSLGCSGENCLREGRVFDEGEVVTLVNKGNSKGVCLYCSNCDSERVAKGRRAGERVEIRYSF